MPEMNSLSAGIKSALAEALKPARVEASPELLAEDAQDALEVVEVVIEAMGDVIKVASSERAFLSLQLLRASCDHARAILFLLSKNPVDLAGSALALHRAQIEAFLRAGFYSQIATDEEFESFFEDDAGPQRRTAKGKWQRITVPELAKEVQECLNKVENAEPGSGKLASMVANAWHPLCAMVHGGRAIHALYVDDQQQIGCSIPADIQFQAIVNTVVLVNFSLVFTSVISGKGGQEENEALGRPIARFHQFVDQHNARLRSVGLHDMQRFIG